MIEHWRHESYFIALTMTITDSSTIGSFTDLMNHLQMPKSVICEEIVRVDMDHSHSIDWHEFTIYYNLLMQRSSRGEIKECLVHVVENPFPGSLPDATQVVHLW